MPTKMKRYSVSLPDDLENAILRDCLHIKETALENRRSASKVSARIVSVLLERYQLRIPQPMVFGRPQPVAKESRRGRLLVFGGPSQLATGAALNPRASHGKG